MAVRRVRRVVRRVDPWTVLKIALVFNAIAGLVFVLGVWVVWSLVLQRGIPDRIVEIFEAVRITIAIDGQLYFRIVVFLAVVGAVAMTGLMTLGAVLYNLIADLVGGVELTVLEETYILPAQPVVQERVRPAVYRGAGDNGEIAATRSRVPKLPPQPVLPEAQPEGPPVPADVPAAVAPVDAADEAEVMPEAGSEPDAETDAAVESAPAKTGTTG